MNIIKEWITMVCRSLLLLLYINYSSQFLYSENHLDVRWVEWDCEWSNVQFYKANESQSESQNEIDLNIQKQTLIYMIDTSLIKVKKYEEEQKIWRGASLRRYKNLVEYMPKSEFRLLFSAMQKSQIKMNFPIIAKTIRYIK